MISIARSLGDSPLLMERERERERKNADKTTTA